MSLWRDFADKPPKSNTPFVIVLGLCPTLAVSTSIKNGLAMAAAATAVLIGSNLLISLIRRYIPNQIRIACYIVVIAGFVTMVEIIMKAVAPEAINRALGIFIPLIVVNCIILGRAEAFAASHGPMSSLMDALGIGVGYFMSLALISFLREILGAGTLWGFALTPLTVAGWTVIPKMEPLTAIAMAPGAFIVMGLLFGLFAWMGQRKRQAVRLAATPAIPRVARDFPKPAKAAPQGKLGDRPRAEEAAGPA